MSERTGRCHDCTAPQTETNMLCRHILELQKDKGELIDKCRELEARLAQAEEIIRAVCEGYASTVVGENEMIERVQKAEAFLKE